MAGIPHNVEDLLTRLTETSRTELELVRALSEAVRRADDELLKEVRSVTMLHEIRRDAIFGELQHLAARLCALPVQGGTLNGHAALQQADMLQTDINAVELDRDAAHPVATVEHMDETPAAAGAGEAPAPVSRAGDWRTAAQRIDEELEQYFGGAGPRH